MLRFFVRRLLISIPILFAVATLTFFLVRAAPGDPFADEKKIPESSREEIVAFYGLDLPLWHQYLRFLGNIARLDPGYSYSHPGYSVTEIIGNHFPITLAYAVPGFLLALAIGIPLGSTAAIRHGKFGDWAASGFAMVGICLPTFVIGPLLALLFGGVLGILPSVGWMSAAQFTEGFSPWSFVVLPALTLAILYAAFVTRLSRSGLIETLRSDFIRTARAKGLPGRRILWRHALPVSLLPVINFLGPALAGMLTGSFVVETIFNIPGLGQFFIEAAINRDYPLLLGLVVFYAALILLLNLLVDLLQAALNPRIRETLGQ
ncbi:ABC transporter permease subunit [Puniceicoccus vermicola]|uniref:ABC transporter permease n=1 Tax=Puniceicoccus vermicola TaxID=388746 RepID=A0A7X1E5Z9_9BACT|nr:ABC transporter permease [Puniceicoccus vermicola]